MDVSNNSQNNKNEKEENKEKDTFMDIIGDHHDPKVFKDVENSVFLTENKEKIEDSSKLNKGIGGSNVLKQVSKFSQGTNYSGNYGNSNKSGRQTQRPNHKMQIILRKTSEYPFKSDRKSNDPNNDDTKSSYNTYDECIKIEKILNDTQIKNTIDPIKGTLNTWKRALSSRKYKSGDYDIPLCSQLQAMEEIQREGVENKDKFKITSIKLRTAKNKSYIVNAKR